MNIPLQSAGLGLLLAVVFGQPMQAHAGLTTITRGDASMMSAILVVSAPVFVSIAVGHSVGRGSEALGDASNKASAGPLPPMRVKSVEKTTDGGCEVQLQDPAQADNTALLRWPARQDDPTAGFHVGDTVTFQPSPAGAGWTVQSPQGQALAFVPTADAAAQNSSKTW
ncbi:hypothetical protein LMG31886_06430 [Xanthomonas hydrangeae]|uniref:hypothetical protein n=1 Tax=Xanthomonas hydrangeae TaxID=2775159 RepID=UPI001962EABA|nr:hypothetical protein LMG31884_06490 [Xanthomonas hydrangeae]CAD7713520.1 hypothetical protein LMG31884_06490 [Xanthomonas hydrangeae]CAD7720102.1 hypothetical protein LMG31887_06490 [Xanthomonas hydrangeae]CAD7720106.1 hypothetical protein LMG31887_06490 [Xanthomonas hydrangeae]CAD7724388.1 hypothetical protein LMG31886_06430 [Xanthomonas hydrangeae]